MIITDNYNISNLFITKKIILFLNSKMFPLKLWSIRTLTNDIKLNQFYHLIVSDPKQLTTNFGIKFNSSFDFLKTSLCEFGGYKETTILTNTLSYGLNYLFDKVEITMNNIKLNDITLTEEIWDYILYILKLSNGEKVEKPRTFNSEEEKQFYLAQKANEERIKKIRGQQEGDPEGLAKILLSINYAFPGLTIDYLLDQTMAQIQWLQKYAAGSVSYEVNAKAFAAGNMKKGSKLDFFIK